jgi:hypothetical protein
MSEPEKKKYPKSEKRKRTKFIRARVSEAEQKEFLRRCNAAELSAGDYIRVKCLDAEPLRKPAKRRVDEELMAQALHQIGQLGKGLNNVNQVAKSLNTTMMQPDVTGRDMVNTLKFHEKNLLQIYETVQEFRSLIRQTLLNHDPTG